jgi:hypothetical protein
MESDSLLAQANLQFYKEGVTFSPHFGWISGFERAGLVSNEPGRHPVNRPQLTGKRTD